MSSFFQLQQDVVTETVKGVHLMSRRKCTHQGKEKLQEMEGRKSALNHGECVLLKSSVAPSGLAESLISIGVT